MTEETSGRYCKSCRYDLRGSVEPVCPECGRAFDPKDQTSYLKHPSRKLSKLLLATEATAVSGLLAILGAPWLYYLASCMEDGSWPKPAYNTPEGTNNLFVALPVVVVVFILQIPILIGSLFIFFCSLFIRIYQDDCAIRSYILWFTIPFLWAVVVIDQSWDLWNIWYWIYD